MKHSCPTVVHPMYIIILFCLFHALPAHSKSRSETKSIVDTKKAMKCEMDAADYMKEAIACLMLAEESTNEQHSVIYRDLARTRMSLAQYDAGMAYAYRSNDADFLDSCKALARSAEKQARNLEKALKAENLDKPDIDYLEDLSRSGDSEPRHARAAQQETSALNCMVNAEKHQRLAEVRQGTHAQYHTLSATNYLAMSKLHWTLWKDYFTGKTDSERRQKLRDEIKALQDKQTALDKRWKTVVKSRVYSDENASRYELYATNFGMRAVKCNQISMLVSGNIKKIYSDLATNYRSASALHRKKALALRTGDQDQRRNTTAALNQLAEERKDLWKLEKDHFEKNKHDENTREDGKKIRELKAEYRALEEQLEKMTSGN